MHGDDLLQTAMFSYITLERRIPAHHPLRAIRRLTDRALERMGGTGTSCTRRRAAPRLRSNGSCGPCG